MEFSRLRGTGLSDATTRSDTTCASWNLSEKVDKQIISEDADRTADILIGELKRSAAEYRTRTAQLQSFLDAFGLNPTELSSMEKSAVADAVRVRQARRGDDVCDEIAFDDDVFKTVAEAKAERSLNCQVRRLASRSSRLGKDCACLEKVIRTKFALKKPSSTDVVEWRAKATQIENDVKILRKKLDDLRVPSDFSLRKRYEECMALKTELNAVQERLKRFAGLPPSLAGAAQKLEESKAELNILKSQLRNIDATMLKFSI